MTALIGIDPDIDKNGVAYIYGKETGLFNYTFFELFDFLKLKKSEKTEVFVVVEGGWLNKSNWHTKKKGSAALNAKIGSYTGANHETGKKIVEMLEYLKIPYKVTRPTKTKLKEEYFKKLTGLKGRHNQEQRDAYMLIFGLKKKIKNGK